MTSYHYEVLCHQSTILTILSFPSHLESLTSVPIMMPCSIVVAATMPVSHRSQPSSSAVIINIYGRDHPHPHNRNSNLKLSARWNRRFRFATHRFRSEPCFSPLVKWLPVHDRHRCPMPSICVTLTPRAAHMCVCMRFYTQLMVCAVICIECTMAVRMCDCIID